MWFRVSSKKGGQNLFRIALMSFVIILPFANAQDSTDPLPEGESSPYVMKFKGMLPEILPIPGDPRPYEASPYATQIDKALAYMAYKERDPNRLFWLWLLDYLQRRYGLHERYSLRVTQSPQLWGETPPTLGNMQRLIQPDFDPTEEAIKSVQDPLERIALQSLYCDIHRPSVTLVTEMNHRVREGMSPILPTVGLAFLWLRENDCLVSDRNFMEVRDGLAVKFRNHLRENGVSTYMVGHALALMFALGHGDMVDPEWLKAVAESQNEDGGWPGYGIGKNKSPSEGPNTVMILWTLLQHALPDAPKVPMIPRPEEGEDNIR